MDAIANLMLVHIAKMKGQINIPFLIPFLICQGSDRELGKTLGQKKTEM